MTLGNRIKELRVKQNLSQKELAKKLYVSDKTISSWESNRTEPSLDMVYKLSEVFACTSAYILYGESKKGDIETEIRVKLTEKEYKDLIIQLEYNSVFIKEIKQEDMYYEPSYRKFTLQDPINEWLRIGKRGNKVILNYKNWHENKYCDEYEVELDDAKNMDKILQILGLNQIAVVNKKRKVFLYKEKYEFSLDSVENLGYFVEIEIKKYDQDALEEYENLLRLAKEFHLNLDNIDKRGYPYYFIEKNKML